MSCSLKADFSVSGSTNVVWKNRGGVSPRAALQFKDLNSKEICGKTLEFADQGRITSLGIKSPKLNPVYGALRTFGKAQKWWEKSLQPNMVEITSAQHLVHHLLNGGDTLMIVDFYSPGCGGCKALHPKICQIAESNPNAVFLMVNYEQHKEMCYALNVHVLPFFRFYRGAEGRVCSFSCTNATLKKFRDALAKHGTERCTLGPVKGLNESEMMALASIGQIPSELVPKLEDVERVEAVKGNEMSKGSEIKMGVKEENAMAMA